MGLGDVVSAPREVGIGHTIREMKDQDEERGDATESVDPTCWPEAWWGGDVVEERGRESVDIGDEGVVGPCRRR